MIRRVLHSMRHVVSLSLLLAIVATTTTTKTIVPAIVVDAFWLTPNIGVVASNRRHRLVRNDYSCLPPRQLTAVNMGSRSDAIESQPSAGATSSVRSPQYTPTDCDNNHTNSNSDNKSKKWLKRGMMISSFTDGLKTNQKGKDYLRNELMHILLKECQQSMEQSVQKSVMFSPCNGPDVAMLEKLESIDTTIQRLSLKSPSSLSDTNDRDGNNENNVMKLSLPPLRFLFIPTAMYALRPDSKKSPGLQRKRSRADGKQRRDDIVRFLREEIVPANQDIHVVTMDFHDSSIKHPHVDFGSRPNVGSDDDIQPSDVTSEKKQPTDVPFPRNGKEAITQWNPHIIFVQGGNTFWLYHCIEKFACKNDFIELLVSDKTIYIGASAGAIVTGAWMETACWKGWDDPRIVPGRETYHDWIHVPGWNLVDAQQVFFPHYDANEWSDLVQRKHQELSQRMQSPINVCCLRDEDICVIDGTTQQFKMI